MPRVAVTGGSGKLGRAVVRELLDHGWDVVNLDRAAPAEPLCPFVRVDLTDYGQVVGALTAVDDRYDRVDAVAHLAAVPAPGLVPNTAVFGNNITSTYHVFTAARLAGIRNVVWASSETVLGLPFDTPPPYLPVDEEYPARPESNYSLAKHLEEQLAAQLCRWDPTLTMVGLRFSNVMDVSDYARFPSFDADPGLRRWNLWSYIDARDGAQAVRRGLEYRTPGAEVFVIASPDTVMSTPSAELAAAGFPDVEVRTELGRHESLMSTAKARRLLGYAPSHSWRDHV
ncbi:NAD-dependent epimerase/dehydratase family protein [Streptomyces sp. NPDC127098]|uniref:NAD-dependent epimerase/dehydratase family protein n=1 Tax=Streptomyces sp. NPDC127098 TaxID=3347137 RepID=UPI0036481D7D